MIFYLSKLGISRKSGKEVIPQTADTYVAQALFGVTCASSALVSHWQVYQNSGLPLVNSPMLYPQTMNRKFS